MNEQSKKLFVSLGIDLNKYKNKYKPVNIVNSYEDVEKIHYKCKLNDESYSLNEFIDKYGPRNGIRYFNNRYNLEIFTYDIDTNTLQRLINEYKLLNKSYKKTRKDKADQMSHLVQFIKNVDYLYNDKSLSIKELVGELDNKQNIISKFIYGQTVEEYNLEMIKNIVEYIYNEIREDFFWGLSKELFPDQSEHTNYKQYILETEYILLDNTRKDQYIEDIMKITRNNELGIPEDKPKMCKIEKLNSKSKIHLCDYIDETNELSCNNLTFNFPEDRNKSIEYINEIIILLQNMMLYELNFNITFGNPLEKKPIVAKKSDFDNYYNILRCIGINLNDRLELVKLKNKFFKPYTEYLSDNSLNTKKCDGCNLQISIDSGKEYIEDQKFYCEMCIYNIMYYKDTKHLKQGLTSTAMCELCEDNSLKQIFKEKQAELSEKNPENRQEYIKYLMESVGLDQEQASKKIMNEDESDYSDDAKKALFIHIIKNYNHKQKTSDTKVYNYCKSLHDEIYINNTEYDDVDNMDDVGNIDDDVGNIDDDLDDDVGNIDDDLDDDVDDDVDYIGNIDDALDYIDELYR